jgi:hypothetical protein
MSMKSKDSRFEYYLPDHSFFKDGKIVLRNRKHNFFFSYSQVITFGDFFVFIIQRLNIAIHRTAGSKLQCL